MKDILLNAEADLAISNGEFRVGESKLQHVILIAETSVGHWKSSAVTGAYLVRYKNLPNKVQDMISEFSKALTIDGMKLNQIKISPKFEFDINGDY